MIIRPIQREELAAFSSFSANAKHNNSLARYLSGLWTAGSSRPAWCFVAEDAAQIRGRVVFWALPSATVPTFVEFLDLPWTGDYLEAGVPLLCETLNGFRDQGATSMRYLLDLPSHFGTYPDQRVTLLTEVGFSLRRHGERWEWQQAALPAPTHRLRFRLAAEVGDDSLVNVLARAMEGTLDQALQQDRRRLGTEGAAQAYLATARSLPGAAIAWHLAATADGAWVGIVMPSANDGGPIIDFLGVVPEQRGRGYSGDLLAQGMATLHAAGATRIRADTDRNNTPMAATFRRAGFRRFRTRLEYGIDLSSVTPAVGPSVEKID